MSSCIGNALRLSVFGQSHSHAIGCTIDGLPAGIPIDQEELQAFCARRAPGFNATSTTRREADHIELVSGVVDQHTCGVPLCALIKNTNTKSQDYAEFRAKPRPGHADYAGYLRYRGWQDVAGGGHFSGRLTAPLCVAGGIAAQALAALGITIVAHISALGPDPVVDESLDDLAYKPKQRQAVLANILPCIDTTAAKAMREVILAAKHEADSVGGIVECAAYGVPQGIGDPMFDGMENRISQLAFGIPAVKGIEFGAGFDAAFMRGSEHNDPFATNADGEVFPVTNNAGGALGGITTGAPLIFRLALKPTPSIGKEQKTVDVRMHQTTSLVVQGRHDPCIVPRAVPVAEAICAFALLDALLEDDPASLVRLYPKRPIA